MRQHPVTLYKALCIATLACAAAVLAGCAAPRSYVVLLPSQDGSVGQFVVRGQRGEQVLNQARYGSALDGGAPPFEVKPDDLQRDFGAAMAARPELPVQFLLYFEVGGAELTAESKALLPRILEQAQSRKSVDMSVIGHSDTQGKAETNEALALERAKSVAAQLREMGLTDTVLAIESHGERNLLIPTPDETPEPRNRRVEITLR
jgi:outer membrane protein OmpA-like peptidoglycan-associated protein